MERLYVGQVAPHQYVMTLTAGSSGLDMTTVSAVNFSIRKPDGTTATWSTSISGATTSQLTATHNLAGPTSEVDVPGTWRFYAQLTVGGGTRRTEHWYEDVLQEHGN